MRTHAKKSELLVPRVNYRHQCGLVAGLAGALAGCVAVQSTPQVEKAMSLAHQQTGVTPQWTQEWDEVAPAWAEGEILPVEKAVEYALRNNRELRAEVETIGQAQADLVQAGLLQNPMLTLATKFPSGGGRALFEGGMVPFQGLRDLWLIPIKKDAANAALQDSLLRVADLAVALTAQVKVLYAKIQHLQRSIELTRENLAIIEQMVQLIQSRHTAGKTSQIEVNTERIRRMRLHSDLLAMQAEHKRAQHEFLMLIGFADAPVHWTVSPIHEMETESVLLSGEEELVESALNERLDLCSARWSVWAAGKELAMARGEAWPAFDVSVVFEREAAPRSQNQSFAATAGNAAFSSLTGGEPEGFSPQPFGPKPRDGKWMVGPMIDLEIPIFDQNQAQIAKAAHELRRRLALQSALQQRVIQKVREFKVMNDQANEQVQIFRGEIIPEVDANLELIRQSYRTGADVFTNYLRAQEDLIITRQSALGFLRDAAVSRAELEREVGGRLPDVIEKLIHEDANAPAKPSENTP